MMVFKGEVGRTVYMPISTYSSGMPITRPTSLVMSRRGQKGANGILKMNNLNALDEEKVMSRRGSPRRRTSRDQRRCKGSNL